MEDHRMTETVIFSRRQSEEMLLCKRRCKTEICAD